MKIGDLLEVKEEYREEKLLNGNGEGIILKIVDIKYDWTEDYDRRFTCVELNGNDKVYTIRDRDEHLFNIYSRIEERRENESPIITFLFILVFISYILFLLK